MANTYLTRTPSSASNRKTWTWSAWVKRSSLSTGNQVLFVAREGGFPEKIQFNSSDQLEYDHDIAGTDYTVRSDMLFRDTSAWYHIVVAKDTTQSTETNRLLFYANGQGLATTEYQLGYPPQNYNGAINNTVLHTQGSDGTGYEYFSGSMSHIHFCDGTALAPTVFGETDATTGEWKIKTSPSFTLGTNGFTILKDGNTITDQSSNSNNFSLAGGTLTKTEDNPSNVFATLNALDNFYSSSTFSNGNLTTTTGYTSYAPNYSTLAASSGKYYCEVKKTAGSAARIGIMSRLPIDSGANSSPGNNAYSVGYFHDGNYYINGSATSYGDSYANGDIIGIAMDLDNNRLFFSKNGTWQNSSDPTSSTGAITIPTSYSGFYHFAVSDQHDGSTGGFTFNFGNGYFATTAVASAGTNASGNGIFEYDVPTGYTALSTKGLNL